MNTITIKTQDLTGQAFNWAVATLCGYTNLHRRELRGYERPTTVLAMDAPNGWIEFSELNYSTDWAQGGPIIEREGIDTLKDGAGWTALKTMTINHPHLRVYGPTPLIAAMRCYVASVLGDTVEVPEELV